MPAVFLIEDCLSLQKVIETLLSINGYEVFSFDSGPPALERLETFTPDLILCDIVLPGLDGYEILQRTRQLHPAPETPFIFLSALTDRDQIRKGMNLGADDYITKPFTSEGLLAAVRVRIERAASWQGQVELEQSQSRERTLVSLPHELRTPLNGIVGGISLLREETKKSHEGLQDVIGIIEESARRLEDTLLRYLMFLELQSSRFPCQDPPGSIDAGLQVASVALDQARAAGREQDLLLHTREAHVPCGECLERITTELVSNAFKFSEPGTKVEIRMNSNGGKLRLTCRDHGRGMTAKEVSEVGPFVQFHRKEYEQQGLGLGLAICRAIMKCEGCALNIIPASGGGLIAMVAIPEQMATA